jgi:predicted Zn-ribbon and HTH transcriptional regulator
MPTIHEAVKCKFMTLTESKKVVCGQADNPEEYCNYEICSLWEQKEEEKVIDSTCTRHLVCPHCGYEDDDSELDDSSEEYECPVCEKTFSYEREYSVTYTSWK